MAMRNTFGRQKTALESWIDALTGFPQHRLLKGVHDAILSQPSLQLYSICHKLEMLSVLLNIIEEWPKKSTLMTLFYGKLLLIPIKDGINTVLNNLLNKCIPSKMWRSLKK